VVESTMNLDEPKSLSDAACRAALHARLREPHILPLTKLVDQIRLEQGCGIALPYCDPADGGIQAECLFVLEAPGPRAVASGFVSRNNPDETAKNFMLLTSAAEIPRALTATWNIVPWYIGDGKRIRAATSTDVTMGWPYLQRVLRLLPNLRVIMLVGQKPQRIHSRLAAERPDLKIMDCPHPSPLFINRRPENRGLLLNVLLEAAAILKPGNPMSEQSKVKTPFLDRLTDWRLEDLIFEEEKDDEQPRPKPEKE
jgi:uracil-DNA glycosylase